MNAQKQWADAPIDQLLLYDIARKFGRIRGAEHGEKFATGDSGLAESRRIVGARI